MTERLFANDSYENNGFTFPAYSMDVDVGEQEHRSFHPSPQRFPIVSPRGELSRHNSESRQHVVSCGHSKRGLRRFARARKSGLGEVTFIRWCQSRR